MVLSVGFVLRRRGAVRAVVGAGLPRAQCKVTSPEGAAREVIVERASALGVGLILMTTHGRGGLGRLVFGSTADSVLRHAPCPVLLVRIQAADGDESASGL